LLSRNRFFLFAAAGNAGRAIVEADPPGTKSHTSTSVQLGIRANLVFISRAFCERYHWRKRSWSLL
jgi:hypothetical protein